MLDFLKPQTVLLVKNRELNRIKYSNAHKVKVKSLSHARLFVTPWTVACTKLLCPWGFLGKSTGVGCRFLLQGIFPTQRSNPGLPHCRQTLYRLSHQGRLPEEPGRLQSTGSQSRTRLSNFTITMPI